MPPILERRLLESPEQLSPWHSVRFAFTRAGRLIISDNLLAYIILAIFSVIDGALMHDYTYTGKDLFDNAFPLSAWLAVIAFYFTLGAAMRERDPSYKMTPGSAFGITTAFLLSLLATVLGMLCLIVPGVWIGTKLSLAPYLYAVRPAQTAYAATDAVVESWNLTTGVFWPTCVLSLWLVLLAVLPWILLTIGALALFERSHVSAYFSAPLLLLVNIYLIQVSGLAMLDWASRLRANHL